MREAAPGLRQVGLGLAGTRAGFFGESGERGLLRLVGDGMVDVGAAPGKAAFRVAILAEGQFETVLEILEFHEHRGRDLAAGHRRGLGLGGEDGQQQQRGHQ